MSGPSRAPRAAIVLGGGKSERMGTDKLALTIAGHPLLQRTVAAALRWTGSVVTVGPARESWPPGLCTKFVVETPPFSGPAAGIEAGLGPLQSCSCRATDSLVMVLAGDLENPIGVVQFLSDAVAAAFEEESADCEGSEIDGVALVDQSGWVQYLAAVYRQTALESCVAKSRTERGSLQGLAVRRLLAPLSLHLVPAPDSITGDLDTPGDLRRARNQPSPTLPFPRNYQTDVV